jgi:hypothetical protein
VSWRRFYGYDVALLKGNAIIVAIVSLARVLKLHFNEVANIVVARDVGIIVVCVELFVLSATTFRGKSAQTGMYHKFFVHIFFRWGVF